MNLFFLCRGQQTLTLSSFATLKSQHLNLVFFFPSHWVGKKLNTYN